jgi:cytoskeletal protein RodZ
MESIGEKLRSARVENGFTINQIARDTNIAKHYIEALEEERFDEFPAEPYLLGFLRNYSEYLSLNPDEMISLYKSFKIQEQPVPMEQLLEKKSRLPLVLGLSLGLLAAGGIGAWFYLDSVNNPDEKPRQIKTAAREKAVYILNHGEELEKRFFTGDKITAVYSGNEHDILIGEIKTDALLAFPGGSVKVSYGEERAVDIDGDLKGDIKVLLRDIDLKNPESGILLKLEIIAENIIAEKAPEQPSAAEEVKTAQAAAAFDPGTPATASRKKETQLIMEKSMREPFTLNASFRSSCLVNYSVDGGKREQKFFHKGEAFMLEARNEVKFWISNAGSINAGIAGKDLVFGKPGEVAARSIKWEKDDGAGGYKLKLFPLY